MINHHEINSEFILDNIEREWNFNFMSFRDKLAIKIFPNTQKNRDWYAYSEISI